MGDPCTSKSAAVFAFRQTKDHLRFGPCVHALMITLLHPSHSSVIAHREQMCRNDTVERWRGPETSQLTPIFCVNVSDNKLEHTTFSLVLAAQQGEAPTPSPFR